MMAKPIKILELHYPMIQFLVKDSILSASYEEGAGATITNVTFTMSSSRLETKDLRF